jgi:hypothetical protein
MQKIKGNIELPDIEEQKEKEDDKFEQISLIAQDWLNGKYKQDQIGNEKPEISQFHLEQAYQYIGKKTDRTISQGDAVGLSGSVKKTKRRFVLRKIGTVTSVSKLKSVV